MGIAEDSLRLEVAIMKEALRTLLNFGLGTLVITKEKVEQLVAELIKQGDISKDEGTSLVGELIEKGKKSEVEIKLKIEQTLQDMLLKLDVPTRKEISDLKTEINRLKKAANK